MVNILVTLKENSEFIDWGVEGNGIERKGIKSREETKK
jgi:hypothetical protein